MEIALRSIKTSTFSPKKLILRIFINILVKRYILLLRIQKLLKINFMPYDFFFRINFHILKTKVATLQEKGKVMN